MVFWYCRPKERKLPLMKKTLMTKTKRFNLKKWRTISFCSFLMATAIFSTGCSKDDDDNSPDDGNGSSGKNIKITVTVSSAVDQADYISLVSSGGTLTSDDKTVWKTNGAIQNSQQAISLGRNDFTGSTKTYVIESIKQLDACSIGVQFINFDQDLKFSLKIEVNGKVSVDESNKTLTGEGSDFTKQYQF